MAQELLNRIEEMNRHLSEGSLLTQPSKFWKELNDLHLFQIKKYGFNNFKRTIVRKYFTNVPFFLLNRQILFLLLHVNSTNTLKSLFKSLFLPKHKYFSWVDSVSLNFLTFLLWEYARQVDSEGVLDRLEEPLVGNPPKIYYEGKVISQDIANSVLEYKSIFTTQVNKEKIRVVAELGAGYGRNAFVFLNLLENIKYIIIDIPPALAIAETYISKIFPRRKIFKYRRFESFSAIKNEFNKSDIVFFLPNQMKLLPPNMSDLFLNISSLHEMRLEQIAYYFEEIYRLTKQGGFFYFKEWKQGHIPHEGITITIGDYPISKQWTAIFLREAKVQTKFFECLLKKTIHA